MPSVRGLAPVFSGMSLKVNGAVPGVNRWPQQHLRLRNAGSSLFAKLTNFWHFIS